MEVDSCHALIERTIRKKEIYTPACYIPLIETAKKKKPYYKVHYLDHNFFTDFSERQVMRRWLIYHSSNIIMPAFLLLEHTADEWTPLPQRLKEVDFTITIKKTPHRPPTNYAK